MLCKEVIRIIEDTYPKQAAEKWDNVGLLAGRLEKEVRKTYVALDATDEVIASAIAVGADMLVTHHPLIFSPIKSITDADFIGRRIVRLLQHDISYYAMHTNYDVLRMAKLASGQLELQEVEVLDVTMPEEHQGIGCVGRLKKVMTLNACCEFAKECFDLQAVRCFGDREKEIHRVAICPGSGKSVIPAAIQMQADVLLTGDIGHHEGIDAVAQGLTVIDAGHYGLEQIFIADMAAFLKDAGMEVVQEEIRQPFETV